MSKRKFDFTIPTFQSESTKVDERFTEDFQDLVDAIHKVREEKKKAKVGKVELFVPVTIHTNEFLGLVFRSSDDGYEFIKETDPEGNLMILTRVNLKLPLDNIDNRVYALVNKDTNSFSGSIVGSKEAAYDIVNSDPNFVVSKVEIQPTRESNSISRDSASNYDDNKDEEKKEVKTVELYVPVTTDTNEFLGLVFKSYADAKEYVTEGPGDLVLARIRMDLSPDAVVKYDKVYALVDKDTNSFFGSLYSSKEEAYDVANNLGLVVSSVYLK